MKNPLLQKCVLLALIGALLLIPLSMIEHTIDERTAHRAEAIRAIAAGSAGEQSIQYLLVGLAQAIFFLLLTSLSEHIAFSLAYLIAATASIALIGIYLAAILHGGDAGWASATRWRSFMRRCSASCAPSRTPCYSAHSCCS